MAIGGRRFDWAASIVLTLGSAVFWGLAHLATWRRTTGLLLLGAETFLVLTGYLLVTRFQMRLLALAVQPGWLTALSIGLLVLGAAWAAIIIRSYTLVRPAGRSGRARAAGAVLAGLLCVAVMTPLAYAARMAHVSRDLVLSIFGTGTAPTGPWEGERRVNVLLLGGDSAPNRYGVRTDSITLATIDVRTGRTVLFGLPRNLQRIPLPEGPARDRFPYGFTGDPPASPGIINELFQYAEDHPEIVPHAPAGSRGPTLLKETVAGILGLPVHYYALVDMKGFAALIDAIGGVTVTVKSPIVYGRQHEGYIPAGTRKLSGEAALWFGRSRTDSDDYSRMSRQKCLLHAVARQADPATLLRSFDRLAGAAEQAVSSDIPPSLLPHLIELSGKVRGSHITSLQFVPPLINTADPDYDLIRRKVTETLSKPHHTPRPTASPTPTPTATTTATAAPPGPLSLDTTCE
ncbi:hypothetical protein Misp01_62940 [Microtetraspora sp. NBRC 13810]|uniref:LCP family protein n=1 Tax=Microtetraspora sp. NBRC 13810 TaxID=3030990 RepID=UPI0024A23CC3|nr:LCP family protein [Microtetraspora sp. NBRC 13810]GLW11166.1 hypothetical protein Misp01_62940 [Microtetraspora sp. NBRC 13810]